MKEQIKKFFRGEVDDGAETLFAYSHDASLLEVTPKLVVYPLDTEDVKNLVKWMMVNKPNHPELSITPRCAGTDMSGGSIGESVIMDFTRHMNKLVGGPLPLGNSSTLLHPSGGTFRHQNYPAVASYITVQPGMFYRDFEKITLGKGLILPCYTASKSLNAMGGMYGNNSAGERTLKYGKTEDYILSAKVIFHDGNEYLIEPLSQSDLNKKMALGGAEGEIYRKIYKLINDNSEDIKHAKPKVHKNSAGYYIWNVLVGNQPIKNSSVFLHPSGGTFRQNNSSSAEAYFDLNKLLVGSQGTLGIVTEITFKIIPDIKYSKLVAIFLNDLSPLGRLVDEILELKPVTVESYDDKTMRLAIRFFPDFLKKKGFLGILKLGWSFLPEFLLMLRGGLPKLIVLVEFAGDSEEEVDRQCKRLGEKIKDFKLKVHITKNEAEANKYWDIRRESFALLRKHIKGMHTAPFIDDIIVRPEFLPKFLPELNAILGKYKLTYTLAGHAGDGNFHIIPLMDFKRYDTSKIILELGEEVYDLVVRYRGSITAEHNDGLIRTPYLPKMYDEKTIKIFKEIKDIFDAKNIFNPGKKVATANQGGTKEYIATHLVEGHSHSHKV